MARASSGSRSSISSIDPLMSANSAVTVLRSPSGIAWASASPVTVSVGAPAPALGIRVADAAPRSGDNEVPQSPQNFLSSGFSAPHLGQGLASCAPQSPQNLFPEGLSERHLLQRISYAPSSSSNALASFKSAVSKPSVNHR